MRYWLFLLSFTSVLNLFGQDSLEFASPRLGLKVDLANAVNPKDQTLLFGIEYFLTPSWSFSQEVGVITAIRDERIYGSFNGFKLKEELRYYFSLGKSDQFYTGLNVFYRNLKVQDQIVLGYDCTNQWSQSCAFIEYYDQPIQTHQYGATLRLGVHQRLSSHLMIETDVGLGFSSIISDEVETAGAEFVDNYSVYYGRDAEGMRAYTSIQARVGYYLIKR
ncbi:DUF3575 domain-containing protein [Marinoscillum sp.]|uniref:DUF3575 domain-containing protein n=1 Tax=Marinoscillum sp. TaxID=2024838 RepID=UPI003BABA6F5